MYCQHKFPLNACSLYLCNNFTCTKLKEEFLKIFTILYNSNVLNISVSVHWLGVTSACEKETDGRRIFVMRGGGASNTLSLLRHSEPETDWPGAGERSAVSILSQGVALLWRYYVTRHGAHSALHCLLSQHPQPGMQPFIPPLLNYAHQHFLFLGI